MTGKTVIFFLIGCLWIRSTVAVAQNKSAVPPTDDVATSALLESVTSKYRSKHTNIAIAIGVLNNGQQYVLCKGDASSGMPATADTLFEIGSITKAFTGTLLARMVNEGRINLEDPANSHLPDSLQLPKWKGQSISILDLATHRSSLPVQPPDLVLHALFSGTATNPYSSYTSVQLERMLPKFKLKRAPGTQYVYSNLGAGMLGHAIVHTTKDDYETTVGTLLLKRLKMTSTVINLKPNGLMTRLAVPHSKNGQIVSVWDFGCLKGCGALRSSVCDMLKFSQACLDASKDSDDPVLRSLAVAIAARRDADGGSTRVGLLWHRTKTSFGEMIWHNGGTAGSRSFLGINPATRQTVIVLTNCGVSVDKLAIGVLTDLAKNRKKTKSRPDVPDAAK